MRNTSVILILCILCTGCARNPVTGQKELALVTERQEIQIGRDAFQSMLQAEGGTFTADPELEAYVAMVGKKVAQASDRPHLEYQFVIVNDSTPNAWTLPGGKIAVNRGLLLELSSEAELAAVLGHEIVHAAARHGAKGIERGLIMQGGLVALGFALKDKKYNDILIGSSAAGLYLLQQKYSRNQEFEADHFGMNYMAKAGYDPNSAVKIQEMFLRLHDDKHPSWLEGLFLSHPPSKDRIQANIATLPSVSSEKATYVGKEEYEAKTSELRKNNEAYKAADESRKALNKNKAELALRHANLAINLYPKESLFWQLQGEAFLRQNKPKEASQSFSKAISLNPDYYAPYLARGQALALSGNYFGAKRDLLQSNELLATGEAHELLGRLYLFEGKQTIAIRHFEIASKANSPAGARAERFLQKIYTQ
jgi:predicted Zn-dependent protease